MIQMEKKLEFKNKNTIGIFAYRKITADLFHSIASQLIYSDLVGCKFFFNPQDLIVNSRL